MNSAWYSSTVIEGKKVGRTIGFPTLNLSDPQVLQGKEEGVYACKIKIQNQEYKGALYFGPRKVFEEIVNVLEIYVIDFDTTVYGELVSFQLGVFIRPPLDFTNLSDLKNQLKKDIKDVKRSFK